MKRNKINMSKDFNEYIEHQKNKFFEEFERQKKEEDQLQKEAISYMRKHIKYLMSLMPEIFDLDEINEDEVTWFDYWVRLPTTTHDPIYKQRSNY